MLYHHHTSHQRNGQAETCIEFVKKKIDMIKCHETNKDINLALLQITSPPIGPGIPNPARKFFYRPIGGISLKVNRSPLFYDYDEDQWDMLKARQMSPKNMVVIYWVM